MTWARWSPDGRLLAFIRERQGLVLANADASGQRGVLRGAEAADWSPDGRQLVVAAHDVYVVDVAQPAGRRRLVRLGPDHRADDVAWSPDGSHIAYVDKFSRIVVVGADGRGAREVAKTDRTELVWSPDGARLAYIDRSSRVATVRVDGSRRRVLTLPRKHIFRNGLAWSADGRWIAYSESSVYVVSPAGGQPIPVPMAPWVEYVWSPTGEQLLFGRGGSLYLWQPGADPTRVGEAPGVPVQWLP